MSTEASVLVRDRRALSALLFLGACNEALQAYGTFNSSPQTTELFASAREKTLIKWVRIGTANALVFGSIGAWIGRSVWPLVGTLAVVTELEFLYRYAAREGQKEAPPPSLATTSTQKGVTGPQRPAGRLR